MVGGVLPLWYTLLAVGLDGAAYPLAISELWPRPAASTQYVAARLLGGECHGGAAASACLVPVSASNTLAVTTPASVGVELGVEVFQLAPVLGSGWVVLGEPHKFVATSPHRIVQVVDGKRGPAVDLVGAAGENVTVLFTKLTTPRVGSAASVDSMEGSLIVSVTTMLGKDGTGTVLPP
jgi:hypothetical protein